MTAYAAPIADMRFDERLRGSGAQPYNDTAFSLAVNRAGWRMICDGRMRTDHVRDRRDAGSADTTKVDDASWADTAHNEVVMLLDHVGWPRRPMVLAWLILVGSRNVPGVVQVLRFAPTSRRSEVSRRGRLVLRPRDTAARTGGLDVGFVPQQDGHALSGIFDAAQSGGIELLYLLGADEIDMSQTGDSFVIYQGSHGDRGARFADVILPGAAYVEKSATYVNTEGRVQMTQRSVFPPGDAREDWTIIRALSQRLDATLPFDTLDQLRGKLYADFPHFAAIDQIAAGSIADIEKLAEGEAKTGDTPFELVVEDFFLTNPIARASAIMNELSALAHEQDQGATGTDG